MKTIRNGGKFWKVSLEACHIRNFVLTFVHSSAAQNDWLLPQALPDQVLSLATSLERPYGFLNSYTGYFRHITTVENEVNELGPDPETCPVEERRKRRLAREDEKWDEEYYM